MTLKELLKTKKEIKERLTKIYTNKKHISFHTNKIIRDFIELKRKDK